MKPPVEQVPSPNHRKIDLNRKVTCVIIHATATSGIESPLAWLCDPKSKVSAHYLIGLNGRVIQLVAENDIAWHAGDSEWGGQKSVNAFSIGIELVNANDGKMQYPSPQVTACVDLVAAICQERGITSENVIGHADIAPGRKTDPAGFQWFAFRAQLLAAGIA